MSDRERDILNICKATGIKIKPEMFSDWEVRMEAHLIFGWNEASLNDEDPDIKEEAKEYFELKAKCDADKEKAKRKVELWILEKL